jgi:hypothetical protein
MLYRKIVTAGPAFADADWLDPAITPPDNARQIKIISRPIVFALRGRASSAPDAAIVSLGAMTVDAYMLVEHADGGTSRGYSLAETESAAVPGELVFESNIVVGSLGRLHLTLAAVTAPVIDVLLLAGGRTL